IANHWRERRHQHQRTVHVFLDFLYVWLCAFHEEPAEIRATVGHDDDGVSDVENYQWLINIHLQIAASAAETNGYVIRHNLHGDHGERLGLCRVHLAGHDG